VLRNKRVFWMSDPKARRNTGWPQSAVWKHEHKGRTVFVEIEPFAKLPRWTSTHTAAEAERLAAFVGGDLRLTIKK
jgi:hypothetical protein